MVSFLQKFIFAGIFVTLLLPLVPDAGYFLYPFGRDVLFRIIVEIIFFAYVILVLYDRAFFPRFSWLSGALGAFLAINGLATLLGPQPTVSFWGDPLRNNGLFSQAHLVLFFILVSSMVQTWPGWRAVFTGAGAISGIIALFTIAQALFANPGRAYGTLGNPNFLGAWLLLILFLTIAFFIQERGKRKIILGIIVTLQVTALMLTFSRGAYVGLFLGTLFFIFFIPKSFLARRSKTLLRFTAASVACALLIFVIFARLPGTTALFSPSPQITRIFSTSLHDPTLQTRFESWHAAVRGIQEKPLFGWGPENFSIPFDRYYRGTLEHLSFSETWADRAHNIFLDVASTSGLLGLTIFLFIFFALFLRLYSILKQSSEPKTRLLAGALGATFIAYFAQNSFNLDTPVSLMYVYMLFAFTQSLAHLETQSNFLTSKNPKSLYPRDRDPGRKATQKQIQNSKFRNSKKLLAYGYSLLAAASIFLLIFAIKIWNIDLLAANYHLNKGEEFYNQKEFARSLAEYEKGLSSWTPITHLLHYKHASSALLYVTESADLSDEERLSLLSQSFSHIESSAKERPFYTRTYILGGLLANTQYELDHDLASKEKAKSYFQKARMLSEKRASILKGWSLLDLIDKNFDGAKEKLHHALAINPDSQEIHWLLAMAYLKAGNIEAFRKEFSEEIQRNPALQSEENILKIADICFREIKQYPCAAEYFARLTEKNPQNPKYWTSLALSLKLSGNILEARKAAEYAKTIADPSLEKLIDEFLKKL